MKKELDVRELYALEEYDEQTVIDILTNAGMEDVHCYDTCIDEVIADEDCEDEYLIKACFEGTFDGDQVIFKVFYGDNSYRISDVQKLWGL